MRSKKATLNIVTNLALQAIAAAYGFILPKVIISKFGSEANGLLSSITQFLGYITLLESGFGPVVKAVLYKPIANKDKGTITRILKASESFFRKIALIFIFYIVVLSIVYPHIVNSSFDIYLTTSLIIIIGISTFAEYFFGITYKLYLQAEQKTYITSIIQIATYLLGITIIVILAKFDINITTLKLLTGIVFLLRPILQNIYVRKKYGISLREEKEKYAIQQKWDGMAQHIASVIHGKTDIVVLTVFATLSDVSIYSVYYLAITAIKRVVQSISEGTDAAFGDMMAKGENEKLNKNFSKYETIYLMAVTIIYTCSIILITPFVTAYTRGIDDAIYIQGLFGYLIVTAEYIWAARMPYNSLIKSAGHFRQTRRGAWVECLSNIIISVALVSRFGIVGVAIGTIVAMTMRAAEFVYYTNKYILKRSIWESIKKILLVVAETIIIVLLCSFLPYRENTDYLNWGTNAMMTFLVASVVVLCFNIIFFRKELSEIKSLFKSILHHKSLTK